MNRPEVGEEAFVGELTDAVLAASRVLVGVAAQSIAQVEATMSVGQFRALVIIASRGPMHSAGLAEAMGVHPSNATRTCDGLVAAKLLDRRDNPADRRHLVLTLTRTGNRLVDSVMSRRRALIGQILARMPADGRNQMAHVLKVFAAAGGEPAEQDLWSVGWISGPPAPVVDPVVT
ncbi:MAG: MarR family transcriptional regulator [Actinomycetota bacterium]|nr:MarR family transcriptional regulator [Actinomycetota bacterium]